jgi:uncharacterized protein with HEPN domain
MSERNDNLLLGDIVQSIERIQSYTQEIAEPEFLKDHKTQDAVSRNFEIIGEAASRISPDIKTAYPEVDWIKLKNFRNKIIHDYFGTDFGLVWSIVQHQLPELKLSIEKIIASANK